MAFVAKHEAPAPGPGRPKGSINGLKRALRESERTVRLLPEDIRPEIKEMSPLAVMLYAMWTYANRNNWDRASALASMAAPYIHPKLTSTTINATVRRSADEFDDTELVTIAGRIESESVDDEPESIDDVESLFVESGGAGSAEGAAEAAVLEG